MIRLRPYRPHPSTVRHRAHRYRPVLVSRGPHRPRPILVRLRQHGSRSIYCRELRSQFGAGAKLLVVLEGCCSDPEVPEGHTEGPRQCLQVFGRAEQGGIAWHMTERATTAADPRKRVRRSTNRGFMLERTTPVALVDCSHRRFWRRR